MTDTVRYSGRDFTVEELQVVRDLAAQLPTRTAIADAVCEALHWRRINGRPKGMSARVALLRMADDGLIALPAARNGNGNGRHTRHLEVDPQMTLELPINPPASLNQLGPIELAVVDTPARSKHWRRVIATHHYLGYTPFAGAQLRYLAQTDQHGTIAAFGFAASAWKCAPRDTHIGWDAATREARLHMIVGNARFLVLPHLTVPNLASHLLARVTRRLAADWQTIYGYRPVLLETFVETGRFTGTSYKAANWNHIGQTAGRGKLDRHHHHALAVKDVYLYPLHRNYQRILATPS